PPPFGLGTSSRPPAAMGKTSKKASAAKAVRKAPKRRVQGKTGRSQHAFACFSKEARKDVLAKVHLSDPKNLGAASKALAAAWAELSTQERKPYEASAMLARGQKQLEQLRGSKLKDPVQLQQASKALRAAVEALAESRDVTKAIGLVEALESLDSRLSNPQRSTLALPNWRAAVQGAGAAMGAEVGGRLSALLRKWAEAPQVGRTRTTKKTEVPPKSAARSAGSALDESMRSKFVGILMRIAARTGKACFDACSRVERALFEKCGKDPKEYRQRARSLSHNLGSSDGKLLRQVLEGVLPPWRLVALEAEDLAPEALKAAREEERERYFRSEVHLTGKPLKRKRDLYRQEDPESQPSPRRTAAAAVPAGIALDGDAEMAQAVVVADVESSCETSSSSDETSSDESEVSLWETDFGLLPLQDEPGQDDLCGQAAQASTSASSSSSLVEVAAAPASSAAPAPPSAPPSAAPARRITKKASPKAAATGPAASSAKLDTSPVPRRAVPSPQRRQAMSTLRVMGFEEEPARASLERAGGSLEKAIVMLTKASKA
ncbi:unnamed protein product, partial [Durusdinium trenchii]